MPRTFNIAGPCVPVKHYMIPPGRRIPDVQSLIDEESYFVIHAPRQSGKTTYLRSLCDDVMGAGERVAVYVSLARAQGLVERDEGIPAIVGSMAAASRPLGDLAVGGATVDRALALGPSLALGELLTEWCASLPRPLVLLFDEADCLAEDTLISFLRQLREGYVERATLPFPASVALVGMRNIRDYKAKIRPDSDTLGSASPFNILSDSLTLRNFTRDEVAELYQQHTEDTGQRFEEPAVDLVFNLANGQPWLVNALARHCVRELVTDRLLPVTVDHVEEAKETLILERPTHLDSLMERLREERVRRVIEPILSGDSVSVDPMGDDYRYVTDLGLLRKEGHDTVVSNAIYREVMPRYLNAITQEERSLPAPGSFTQPDGSLDMLALLRSFQQFWRENADVWIEKYTYREAGPHLILQAFLQRVVNRGGAIDREYAAGTGRVDLCVRWKGHRYALELKVVDGRRGPEKVEAEGLRQLAEYLDRLGLTEGYLVLFDQRPGASWEERIFDRVAEHERKRVTVIGA
jgi:hypothetical protein